MQTIINYQEPILMIERFFKQHSNFVYVKMNAAINDTEIIDHIGKLNRGINSNTALVELCDIRNISLRSNLSRKGFASIKAKISTLKNLHNISGKFAIVVTNSFQLNIAEKFIKLASEILSNGESKIFYNCNDAIKFLNTKESVFEIKAFINNCK